MRNKPLTFLIVLLLVCMIGVSFAGCAGQPEPSSVSQAVQSAGGEENLDLDLKQLEEPAAESEIAILHTGMGDITVQLFTEEAPLAVENFLTLAKEGFYDGVTFHRVIADFMIQTGDPTGTGKGGGSIYRDEEGNPVRFADEFSLNALHFRGALSMANGGPDSNGSQFFIVQTKKVAESRLAQMKKDGYPQAIIDRYAELGGYPSLDFRHTVFGSVIGGMDVVDRIANVKTENERPVEDVILERIEVIPFEEYSRLQDAQDTSNEDGGDHK